MESMSVQYKEILHNLQLINSTMSSMRGVVDSMNSALQRNLQWMMSWVGGAKDGLHTLTTVVVHAAFLFLGTLCLLFVGAPAMARVSLLVMVTTNALVEIKFHRSLPVAAMAALQALLLLGEQSD